MSHRQTQRRQIQETAWILFATLLFGFPLAAQNAPAPQAVAVAPNLFRLEGTDPEEGHYIRLLLLETGSTISPESPPRLTFECVDNNGKRDLRMYVSFGGIKDMSFTPPFHPKPGVPYNPTQTNVKLSMQLEGNTRMKPYVESFRVMPNGELRYREWGWHSPNLESIHFWVRMLDSYPGLRIVHDKPGAGDAGEVVFETRPLLDELKKTPMCNP
jgi:hypothetical protein